MTINLKQFRAELEPYLPSPLARPFVCDGSPLECRSFIVGLNAATELKQPFDTYWSNETGFDRARFDVDYLANRTKRGNRPVIEAISQQIGPCLETNVYAAPTKKARQLTDADRKFSPIKYLFNEIRPKLVFVHSNGPINFFRAATGCAGRPNASQTVTWCGHRFILWEHPGPLFTLGATKGTALGRTLHGLF